jgi:hypothetical protein
MKIAKKLNSILESKSLIPDKYLSNANAMKMIKDEIQTMVKEVQASEKGTRGQAGYGIDAIRVDNKSTFPDYLQRIFNGSGTAKKFIQAAKSGKSKYWQLIALEAIDRLENGYKNFHGYDEPNRDFIDLVNNPLPF